MQGKHHIIVEAKRLRYEFDIKRNITVILGDSATGKTTLIEMLTTFSELAEGSGIRVESDVPCVVFSGGKDWRHIIDGFSNSIVFIDEHHHFVFSKEFAEVVSGSTNYFVIITRRPLYNLPYSINEIYGIKTSGRYHYPDKVYHEFYNVYSDEMMQGNDDRYTFYIEDSKAGFEFYRNAFGSEICHSCEGNANMARILNACEDQAVVIADGAAFGAYIEEMMEIYEEKGNIILYLPESFEWLVLRSGVIGVEKNQSILEAPEEYIKSEEYFSWERFFTALLQHETRNDPVKQYSKLKLMPFYYTGKNKDAILELMPKEIRSLALK